jgi:diaminopimelate decarboxylase
VSKPLDFFSYQGGILSSEGVALPAIAKSVGTPVYVYSGEAFLKPLREFQKGLASVDATVCFAVKSNSNIAILKLLSQNGAGMDLVSGGELHRAAKAGVSGKKIVLSGVGKTAAEMRLGLEKEILSFNVESTAELKLLSEVAEAFGKQAPVCLRFNPDIDAKTHPYISTGLKKNKFGIQRAEVLEIVKNIKHYPGIDLRGLSIHIGSQLLSLRPVQDAFLKVKDLIEVIDSKLERPLSILDLGGGIGITYKNEKSPAIQKYCELVLKHFGPKANLKNPIKLVIEPGRILSGNSGVLLTEVLYRKERSQKDFLILDAAMNDLIRPSLYQSYHEIVPVKKVSGKTKKTDVVGPVCETGDCFATDRRPTQYRRSRRDSFGGSLWFQHE